MAQVNAISLYLHLRPRTEEKRRVERGAEMSCKDEGIGKARGVQGEGHKKAVKAEHRRHGAALFAAARGDLRQVV